MRVRNSEKKDYNPRMAWGRTIEMIEDEIKKEQLVKRLKVEKSNKGLDRDTHNRAYISTKIRQYIEEGMKKSDAVLRVIDEEPEIVKQFEYLERAGLDLRVVFYNWVSGRQGPKVDKTFSDGEER